MIKKRKTFYLSGFDPRGPSFYHALFKQNSKGYEVSPRRKKSIHESLWTIKKENTITEYVFLRWDDLIRRYWIKTPQALITKTCRLYAQYFCDFKWSHVKDYDPHSLRTIFHLPLMILFWIILIAIKLPLPLLVLIFLASLWYLKHIQSAWLLRAFIFNNSLIYEDTTEIDKRLDSFAELIRTATQEDYDEIIIVAHSNASVLAIPLIHRLGKDAKNIKLITLGQFIPLVTLNKKATKYTKMLKQLANTPFTWLDISNKGDRACFPLTNPFKHIASLEKLRTKFTMASPQFYKLYTPRTYKRYKLNKFDFHFLYLKKGEIEHAYDYAAITAGTKSFDETIKTLKVVNP